MLNGIVGKKADRKKLERKKSPHGKKLPKKKRDFPRPEKTPKRKNAEKISPGKNAENS